MLDLNQYHVGDNKEYLPKIEDNSVDFIYIDPPYSTGRDFGDFVDKFPSNKEYAENFMLPLLVECKRILKKNGNILVHIEPKISHHIRNVMDEIFGEKNFKNEIVWNSGGNKQSSKKLQRNHDTLLVYGLSDKSKFNSIYKEYSEDYLNKLKWDEAYQDYYSTSALHNNQPNVNPRPNLRYEWQGVHKQWLISKDRMQKLHDEGRLVYSEKKVPRIKKFLKELKGIQVKDTWDDISQIQSGEKLDYATQKPVKLLERIISIYTDSNDLVLDFFAGSGTTGRACKSMQRNFILIDLNPKGKELFEKSVCQIA
jgi:DNA modification methylase